MRRAFATDTAFAGLVTRDSAFAGLLSIFAIGAGFVACHGHDSLAYTTGTTAASSSSAGGSGPTSSSSAGGAGGVGGAGGMGGSPLDGPPKLTIVNGVPDYDAVRFCFLPYPAGDPSAKPWPSQATGLPFARAVHVDPIASAIPPSTDVQTWAIGGDLTQTAGKTCDEILALANQDGGPSVVAVALPIVPAGAFTAKRSLLLVAMGCLGGPGHDGMTATLGCGTSYTPETPTATWMVAPMARSHVAGALGLQVAIADVAAPPADVTIQSAIMGTMQKDLAKSLSPGAISPQVTPVTVNDLGEVDKVEIHTFQPQSMSLTSSLPMSLVFANGNVDASKFANGSHLVLVSVGGTPGTPATSFWHGHTYALVDGDP